MKLLADENIAASTIKMLKKRGYDLKDRNDLKFTGKKDEFIINLAKSRNRVIITLDKDFGNIIRHPLRSHSGIILVAIKNPSPDRVNLYLKKLFKKVEKKKIINSLVIVKESGIKILTDERRLRIR